MKAPSAPVHTTVAAPKTENEHPAGARLDRATLTGSQLPQSLRSRGSWVVSDSIGTGESSIWWRTPPSLSTNRGVRGSGTSRSSHEADRRARRDVRRYAVRNGLDRLGTLTFAPEHLPASRDGVWVEVERFRKRLGHSLGENIPMLAVIERGSKGGRLHVHIVIGQYVPKETLVSAWGRGWVDIKKLRIAGSGKRERCRRAAAYIAKYVTKDLDDETDRQFNGKRYSATKGYRPVRRSTAVDSFLDGIAFARARCGGEIVWAWNSSSEEFWEGPPVTCLHFGDPP